MTTDERAIYVKGLRELADFIESREDVPVPCTNVQADIFVRAKADLVNIARVGRWQKRQVGDYMCLFVEFTGGHTFDVNIEREEVCRKVVTGKRLVPAQPEHEVEEYRWECESLLS